MEKLIKSIYKSSICTSILLLLFGIMLLFKSDGTIVAISYMLGGALIVLGIIALIKYISKGSENSNSLNVIYGTITTIFGILIILNPTAIATIIPFVIGIGILINSSIKLVYAMELKNKEDNIWKSTTIMNAIGALCGILILFNPFKTSVLIFKIIGIIIIIYATMDLVSSYQLKKDINNIKDKIIDNKVKEAEVVEEDDNENIKDQKKKTTKKNKKSKDKGEQK